MARTDCLTNFLIDVSDSIKEKKKDNTPIKACNFDEEIKNLEVGGGIDLSEYFGESIPGAISTSSPTWSCGIKKIPAFVNSGDMGYLYYKFKGTEIDTSKLDFSKATTMQRMYSDCENLISVDCSNFNTSNVNSLNDMFSGDKSLTELDLSSFITTKVLYMSGTFSGCINLMRLDIRNFDFTSVTSYSNMFGSSASNGVPNDCLIIVKDDTAKTWITEKFTRLTNVKTVAEIGG